MRIYGLQKTTLLDFPGFVACTVFTGGCNLRCPFCHNASLVRTPKPPTVTEDEIFTYLERRRGILDGVCITGGEPLLQPDLIHFLLKVKEMDYLVKLDTNGMLPKRLAAVLAAGAVDHVAMDVKSSPAGYAKATGGAEDVTPFEESMKLLRESGVSYEFRTTAVKGIHTVEDFSAIARWLRPDDPYFVQQFVDSGELLGEGCTAFSPEEMREILSAVQEHLPHASLRGV